MRQTSTAVKVRRLAVTLVLPALLLAGVLPPASAGGVPTFVDPPESLRAGTVSVVAPAEGAPVRNQPGVWSIIPGLSTNVYSRAGDNLEITITAEVYSKATVLVRALVDLVPAEPSEVIFKVGNENFDGSRSFTFIVRNVSTGSHIVEMLWFTSFGSSAQIRDRTLSVNSASPTSGDTRLLVGTNEPGNREMITTVSRFSDIPGLSASFATQTRGTLAVTFSAEARVDRGRFYARALVDGQVTSDVLFMEAGLGSRRGARSYTFVRAGLAPGRHVVQIQWRAEGGEIRIGGRTMSAYFSPSSTTGGGMLAVGRQQAPTKITSTAFVTIPSMSGSFATTAPSTSASLLWGGEVQIPSGRLFVRVLVDGQPVSPTDVTLILGGPRWRASSYDFTVKNLLPGRHTVRFQAKVDSGKTARIGDRFMRVVFKRRSGAEFSQPYRELQPTAGIFSSLVICFDPLRPSHLPPSNASLKNMLEGGDGGLSTRGWFAENTHGRVLAGPFTYDGCDDDAWHLAPPAHQGNWYWDNKRFDVMWQEAIKSADPTVDFHSFDHNRDNKITPDELTLIVVRPQNDPYGTNRTVNVSVDGKSPALNFWVVDVYLSKDVTQLVGDRLVDVRRWNVGLLSHELSHAALDAWDLHSCPSITRPGNFSIMDEHSLSVHLDPFHKLKLGLVTADLVELNPPSKASTILAPVETSGDVAVLYDPTKNDREYFIVENRWPGTEGSPTYDSPLSSGILGGGGLSPSGGVLVWHVFQDLNLAQQFKPSGGEACPAGRNSVRRIAMLDMPGEAIDLYWADGTTTNVQLMADRTNPQLATVSIIKLN